MGIRKKNPSITSPKPRIKQIFKAAPCRSRSNNLNCEKNTNVPLPVSSHPFVIVKANIIKLYLVINYIYEYLFKCHDCHYRKSVYIS